MFSLLFSVSNFYFTSQYHQFPLSRAGAAAAVAAAATAGRGTYTAAAAAASAAATTAGREMYTTAAAAAAIAWKFHLKHEKRKQKP